MPPPDRGVDGLSSGTDGFATRELYERSRLIAISERVVRGLLKTDFNRLAPQDRTAAADLIRHFDAAVPRPSGRACSMILMCIFGSAGCPVLCISFMTTCIRYEVVCA